MKRIQITDIPELVRMGRTAEAGSSLAVFWTASGIELKTDAADLAVEIESVYRDLEIWIDIMVDGELSQRIQLSRGMNRIPVFRGLEENGVRRQRTVRIVRDTQAMAQDAVSYLRFVCIETDDRAGFFELPEPEMWLEFIGDSITSGEGAGLERQPEWVPMVFSSVNSYGYLTAQKLNAAVNILSSSGWGLCAGWDGNTESVLPPYYNEVCGICRGSENEAMGSQKPWDFTSYRPDVIVINLGTNDCNAITNTAKWTKEEYQALFIDTAVEFLKTLREKNPDSYLLWAYGMLGRDAAPWIEEALSIYRSETGDDRAGYYEFFNCDESLVGVRWHPNRRAHEKAAEDLAARIREITAR